MKKMFIGLAALILVASPSSARFRRTQSAETEADRPHVHHGCSPGLGHTAGTNYVPGVISNHEGAPIVITVSGDCSVTGPGIYGYPADAYVVTFGNGPSTCTIKASQAAGGGYSAGSAQQRAPSTEVAGRTSGLREGALRVRWLFLSTPRRDIACRTTSPRGTTSSPFDSLLLHGLGKVLEDYPTRGRPRPSRTRGSRPRSRCTGSCRCRSTSLEPVSTIQRARARTTARPISVRSTTR